MSIWRESELVNIVESIAARRLQLFWSGILALLLSSATALTLPFVNQQAEALPWVVGIYLAAVALLGGQIALSLSLRILAGAPTRALAWLAGGYAAVAVFAIGMLLSFPGLAVELTDAPERQEQVSALIWVLWHITLPCFVLLGLKARTQGAQRPPVEFGADRILDLFPVALGIVLPVVSMILSMRYAEALPVLIDEGDFRALRTSLAAVIIVVLNLLALVMIIRVTKLREVLYLWLALAIYSLTLEAVLALASGARYTVGWYVSRGMSLFSMAALMFGLMFENFRLHRDAEIRAAFHEQEALHDPLTGLYNRRYLRDKLPEELGRAKRYRYPLSALLVDLDHFKQVNDLHGHGVGDQCLRILAHAFEERVGRFGDFSTRFGGEEFVIVLPETGQEGAVEVAENIRRKIEGLHARGEAPCPMTVSIGVATAVSAADSSPEQLLATADVCLYRAKQQGRNRIVWQQASIDENIANPSPA